MLARGLLLLLASLPLTAQTGVAPSSTDAPPLTYELVAIHKSKPDANAGWGINNTPEGFIANAINLHQLLSEAYGFSFFELLKEQIVGLPGWAQSQHFDINAKVDVSNVEQLKALRKADTMAVEVEAMLHHKPTPEMLMLQHLVEENFHIKMHYEQRVMPVYGLTVAKGGPRMKVASPQDPEHGSMNFDNGKFTAENVPPDFMTFVLTHEVGRPVVNQTNLPDRYDFEMNYAPENGGKISSPDDTCPSIFTALNEQLGLKLVPAKEPVWIIVVDHIEMPADN
jgi:uncharacterized protein (TIGR03435 family)